MSQIKRVTEETKGDKFNASFMCVYSRGVKPWANDLSLPEKVRNTEVGTILMLNRWDGRVGFPGGMIDEGESPKEAAIREFKEETGAEVDFDRAEWIVSHLVNDGKLCTHMYAIEVPFDKLKDIQRGLIDSDYYFNEITGSVLVYTFAKGSKGLPSFLKNSMASTVLEELITLIKEKELMPKEELMEVIEIAGVNNDCISEIICE